jgi:ATP dependent DNA ligase domain
MEARGGTYRTWPSRSPAAAAGLSAVDWRLRCDEKGVTAFHLLRHRRNEPKAFLYAFDLLELNGADLRREPIEARKATLASILRKTRPGVRLNEHMEHPDWLKFKNPQAPAVKREAEEDWGQ